MVLQVQERIDDATVVFVNNYAFGGALNQELKNRFGNMKHGAKIISTIPFCKENIR